jgi:hypothetical protein
MAAFQRVHDHHEREGSCAERGEQAPSLAGGYAASGMARALASAEASVASMQRSA